MLSQCLSYKIGARTFSFILDYIFILCLRNLKAPKYGRFNKQRNGVKRKKLKFSSLPNASCLVLNSVITRIDVRKTP